jgi:membrane glycosyltransferase
MEPRRRRSLMLALNLGSYAALLVAAAWLLGLGGWTPTTGALFVSFAVVSLGPVVEGWNVLVGLWLTHGARDPDRAVAPFLGQQQRPLRVRIAVFMTLHNEDVDRALLRLRTVKASLDATPEGDKFDYFVLSDTTRPELGQHEEAAVEAWRRQEPADAARITYRRRATNEGYKAGNVMDFCDRWGARYELMVPLDADSLMSGPTLLELAHLMQDHPQIAILQTAIVPILSSSTFARLHAYPARTTRPGAYAVAWRLADCGMYFGHNAMVRVEPFSRCCRLPRVPGPPPLGGPVMSHDHVEAALLLQAGYEVWMLPGEAGSWEENPPSLLALASRNARWLHGNLQYLRLLPHLDLTTEGRLNLAWAAVSVLFVVSHLWIAALLALVARVESGNPDFPWAVLGAGVLLFVAAGLVPRWAGVLDLLLTSREARRYGGRGRLIVGALLDTLFQLLVTPAVSVAAVAALAARLLGRSPAWSVQARDVSTISWREATRSLWPATAFGILCAASLAAASPLLLACATPLLAGYLLAIPQAVWSSRPGLWLARTGLCATPEDLAPPPEVGAIRAGQTSQIL